MDSSTEIGRTLVNKLDGALEHASGEAETAVEARRRRTRVRVRVADADRLGLLMRAVEISPPRGALAALEMQRRLQALEQRVDYLSERLRLVEHDPARTGALMRSAQPARMGADREYFELRVERDGSASFRRFRQGPDRRPRVAVSVLLARDTLARLIDDLMRALAA